MFGYYLSLGWRSLRRNPILTGLMILTLSVGIAASMSTLTVLHMMSGDPIPHKSDRLFVPQFNYGDLRGYDPSEDLSQQVAYREARNLLEADVGVRRVAVYGLSGALRTEDPEFQAILGNGLAPTRDFFAMFEVPFLHGGVWSVQEEQNAADVVVLNRDMAERLFGRTDVVGERVRMGDDFYKVVGVTDHWLPLPKYYRLIGGNGGAYYGEEEYFEPFATAVRHEESNSGSNNCNGTAPAPGWQGWLDSDCTWIQFWFETASASERQAVIDYLNAYVDEQKKLGRFERPTRVAVHDVMEWMAYLEIVGDDSRISTWLAFGFLLVCLVNTVGLLLAKFTARQGEIGVRRALGASRREIFSQYLIEAAVIGLVGGVSGLLLAFGALALIARQSSTLSMVTSMDWQMLLLTIVLAVVASILAGLLPTWRACQVLPALQLKSQ
ncbi:MAG: ABC transporter permease [Xanthomonadales bacterium]|nr:ABC transporter permease [Xanthomonadales bacterium]